MSLLTNAWEVTDEYIQHVMFKHGWAASATGKTAEALNVVDREAVAAAAVLHETDFDRQVDAALSNIEDQLIVAGVLAEPKQFTDESGTDEYEVVVGNVGSVYKGNSKVKAHTDYIHYLDQSKSGRGRAGNQEVTMFKNGEPTQEYVPAEGQLAELEPQQYFRPVGNAFLDQTSKAAFWLTEAGVRRDFPDTTEVKTYTEAELKAYFDANGLDMNAINTYE